MPLYENHANNIEPYRIIHNHTLTIQTDYSNLNSVLSGPFFSDLFLNVCMLLHALHADYGFCFSQLPAAPGWNMFQREYMRGGQRKPTEWKALQAECSKKWSLMRRAEKDVYLAKAAEEQGFRDEAARCPLSSSGLPADGSHSWAGEAAGNLTTNALKTISRQRLMTTYMNFKESSIWKEFDCGLFTADGCMSLDSVDVSSEWTTIQETWLQYAKPDTELPDVLRKADVEQVHIHHKTCHSLYGHCKSVEGRSLATRFVHSMSSLLQTGGTGTKNVLFSHKFATFCSPILTPTNDTRCDVNNESVEIG